MHSRIWNLGIGVVFAVASIVTLIWWIPNDIETGVLVQDRYAIEVGDAMAPTAVAVGILIISLALLVSSYFGNSDTGADLLERSVGLTYANLLSLAASGAVLFASLACMVWAGPVTVDILRALGADLPEYRLLTDTRPYKYIGFAVGGLLLVCGLISWIEGRVSLRAAMTAVGAVVVLIVVYDVPFDSLLLPPNGSQ
ncbi:MAG: hypothetical protein ACR2OV_12070 [Hyphomicrobiaceae bacterium]